MPGRAKCLPGCVCEKHSRPRMSPEDARTRQNERSRAYYEAHREEIAERAQKKRQDPVAGAELRRRGRARQAALTPEQRAAQAQRAREKYQANPRSSETNAAMHFRFRYGLSLEQREQMAIDQDGLCYLCGEPLPSEKRRIHTDHDRSCCPTSRSCGKCVRGLACVGCNTGIGQLGDDPARIRRVADALEAANARVRSQSHSV